MGDARYVFEAKTVQRMELLVLSTLGWGMHPVTPLSFVHYIARRLGAKRGAQWEFTHWDFLRRCERLLVAAVSGKEKNGARIAPSSSPLPSFFQDSHPSRSGLTVVLPLTSGKQIRDR